MSNLKSAYVAAIVLACTLGNPVLAAPAASSADLPGQINVWENRFFFHQYGHDPMEKRLQRLELLVFGETQAGSNAERFGRLKQTIADRDRQSAAQLQSKPPAATKAPEVSKTPDAASKSSSQYPILNTLEWRALKKTYTGDSLDQRLDRLETKLFGQSSPAMAYADRVERLNRVLGIGLEQKNPIGSVGPMPKASPRGQGFQGQIPSFPSAVVPFGDLPGLGQFHGQMAEMMRLMDQQMQQMMRMPPGVYQWDPSESPNSGKIQPGKPVPKSSPFSQPNKILPVPEFSDQPTIPPYNDPNSI